MEEGQRTVEWMCETEPDRVARVFDALDLSREGLKSAGDTWASGDREEACRVLLAYYVARSEESRYRMAPVSPGAGIDDTAEAILRDEYTFQNVTGTPPRGPDGTLDWTCRGPEDDQEWAFFLNRHGHISTLLSAYVQTGNRRYAEGIDAHLREWVTKNAYPAQQTRDPRWRGLETMARITVWAQVFYGLAHDEVLSPAARLLILSSIPDHAHYTQNFHAAGGNWLAMQMTALASAGFAWPEYAEAEPWIQYAQDTLFPQLSRQVYPDGVQKELASHYHGATLNPFQRFADLFAEEGRALPADWPACLELMWNYWADSLRPDGHGVLNNDSNLDFNRPRLLAVSDRYGRPDWAYIASNGEQGTRPDGPPSRLMPWAGQLISRSGFEADAHWSFFDAGPWGIGHQHQDKLHLSVAAFGMDFLVDAGRLYYKRDEWRTFICGTRAHNTLLIDGCVQQPDVMEAANPLPQDTYAITDTFDFARASFTAGYEDLEGQVIHTRAVFYVRGRYWIVVDRVTTDTPRTVEALWHFHPDCDVSLDGAAAVGTRQGKTVTVFPVGDVDWSATLVKGQTDPTIQGWYSPEYNIKTAAGCVTATAGIPGTTTFAWVIVPAAGAAPGMVATICDPTSTDVTIQVEMNGESHRALIPLTGGTPALQ